MATVSDSESAMVARPQIVERESAGKSGREFLFVCHRVPYPPDKGDRIRSYHVLKYLASLGEVDLVFATDEPVLQKTREVLNGICRKVSFHHTTGIKRWLHAGWNFAFGKSLTDGLFYHRQLASDISSQLTQCNYESVICFSSSMLQYVLAQEGRDRVIADLVDVDSQKWFDYSARSRFPLSTMFRVEGARVRAIEQRAADVCRAVTFVSDAESDVYRSVCPNSKTYTVTNGVDLDYYSPQVNDSPEPRSCVFVGYLDYRANVTGLVWFCREIWPTIRERYPDCKFRIVGRNPVAAVNALSSVPGVEVVGPVDDVRDYLYRSTAVVVPLLIARGVQNKILEAMAAGRAVVATPVALQGISAEPNRDIEVAESCDDWLQSLSRIWDEPAERQKLQANARQFVQQKHNWNTCMSAFDKLMS